MRRSSLPSTIWLRLSNPEMAELRPWKRRPAPQLVRIASRQGGRRPARCKVSRSQTITFSTISKASSSRSVTKTAVQSGASFQIRLFGRLAATPAMKTHSAFPAPYDSLAERACAHGLLRGGRMVGGGFHDKTTYVTGDN